MNGTVPVPRPLQAHLWFAVAGAALFLIVATIEGARRPGYDPWHQAISALSLGPGGWVQRVNFIVFGSSLLITVPAWRRILAGGTGATSYPILVAIVGLSFVAAAFIPQDPAPGYDPERLDLGPAHARTRTGIMHLAVAGVSASCCLATFFVMARRFAVDPHWRGWARYSRLLASIMFACIAVYAVWSTQPTGLAGTFERLAIVVPAFWAFTFIRRLSAGTPFMVAGSR